ncbi:MAG TPA: ComF family protein [Pyrinomonadaceae bacterium]|nr:ComF family protein [Pyrinomonadaceae bacterium]
MRVTNLLDNFCDAALSLTYPLRCVACGARSVEARADAPACAGCWRATRVFDGGETLCRKCGALAAASLPEERRAQVRCRRCDGEDFTAARACGLYEGALRAAVLGLKREPVVSARVARLLAAARAREPLDASTLVVPVPLHAERERERGFNQAAVLAQTLAKSSGLPADKHSLVRVAHSERHRTEMDARARRESVEGAFAVERPRLVEGRRVLLVDDVFTTGATVSACARALLGAGALEVFVLTLARA